MKKFLALVLCINVLLLSSCGNSLNEVNETTEEVTDFTDFNSENTSVPDASPLEEITEDFTDNSVNAENSDRSFYGKNTGTDLTVTGFEPLVKADFHWEKRADFDKLATKAISHSYGVAAQEKPHNISIDAQKFFDEKNFDAICYDSKTSQKVLYLTFDCGYENGCTEMILDVLKEKNVSAAFFCTLPQMRDNREIISRMIKEGHIVGNHSVTHPDFSTLSDSKIVDELKGFDDYIRQEFGYSALYFRFPEGKYSEKSLSVINSLGYKCVFWSLAYADWDINNQKGASYALETVMSRIHPGAVILLHAVSPDNANALASIIDACHSMGYEFRSLESL